MGKDGMLCGGPDVDPRSKKFRGKEGDSAIPADLVENDLVCKSSGLGLSECACVACKKRRDEILSFSSKNDISLFD
ncbi:MAG: hypothetical protein HGA61_01835 [Candidatus Moranbacteria bacterium]|nr:hypothetical protein [Candidatus Moranbacteria bacterium]